MPKFDIVDAPKPQAPTPPANPPAAISQTPEQIAEATKSVMEGLWGEDGTKALESDPQPPAAPDAPPADQLPPETPPAAPPAPPAAPEEPETITADDLISRTAAATGKAVADAMRDTQPPATPPAPSTPAFEARKDDKKDFEALEFLAQSNPGQYGKQFEDYRGYLKKLYAYEDQWEKDHPGEEFDPEADEHQDFYQKNEPTITDDDLEDARLQMKAEQLYQKRIAPMEEEMRRKEAFEKNAPAYAERLGKLLHTFVGRVDPSLAELMLKDGKVVISDEVRNQVADRDPIAAEILDEVISGEYYPMIRELEAAAIPELKYVLEPAKNPVHAQIDSYRREKEDQLRALPAEQRARDGREWIPVAEHIRRQQAIQRSHKTAAEKENDLRALNSAVWSLTYDDLEELMIDKLSKSVKSRVEKENARAKKKYGAPSAPSATTQPPPPTPSPTAPGVPPVTQPQTSNKPRPPSTNTPSERVTTPQSPGGTSKTQADLASEAMFGR